MKVLENRTVDSKREMDILDALQDIRARNARNERVGRSSDVVELIPPETLPEEEIARRDAEEEDEALVRQVFSKVGGPSRLPNVDESPEEEKTMIVKRKAELLDDDDDEAAVKSPTSNVSRLAPQNQVSKKKKSDLAKSLGIKVNGKGKAPAKIGIKV